ncbi:hypothetical protein ACGFY7_09965 [Streptomyces prunicolor]|uniref:hypothetical protein n=1 Tax=Streptomyces prunicolor TaxID=67348 RepID=UPI00371DFDB8
MSDLPNPQPTLDGLSKLIPEVVPNGEADPELVTIGERYWALAGFAPELGTPVWCEKAKDIDTAGWGHQIYAVAAAGVRAVVPGRSCSECAGPLSLTSRTAFQQLCDGQDPACVECTESLMSAVRLVVDPARKAKREAAKAKAQERQALDGTYATWRQAQQTTVAEHYATVFPSERSELPVAPVRDMIGALALLRYAPSTSPIDEIGGWPDPLYPDSGKISTLLGSLVRASLLKIHPTSSVDAFVWAPESFEDALREAEGDLDAVAVPELTGNFYPMTARYYAPFGTSPGKAAEQLDAHLSTVLAPAGMTAGQHDDLMAVVQELIAEEALRYFTNRLDELYLPAVPDNHSARLTEAAYKVAEHRPLGEIYNLVWRATRAAAEAAQKNPRAPRTHMSTHAINRFETDAQRAVADPHWELKPFTAIQGQGPAAMTRALFYNVLDTNPIEASVPQIKNALPEPVTESRAEDSASIEYGDGLAVMITWLHAHPEAWDPHLVPAALSVLEEKREDTPEWHFEGKILARDAGKLHRLYERLTPALGVREATLAVLGATGMLVHPVTRDRASVTSGEWILDELSILLFGALDEHTGDESGGGGEG